MSIKLLQSCLRSFLDWYKENNNCLISFLSFSELFPAFNCAKEIGNLLAFGLGVVFLILFLFDFVYQNQEFLQEFFIFHLVLQFLFHPQTYF